ncbi:MAG: TIM barrel protein [Pseudomonadota bacterium]|jgi:sugar phosphate isomerase/epimerase
MPTLSLAHISLLPASPLEMIDAGAAAGFDAVGIRLEPALPDEARFAVTPGSPMMREIAARLDATGLRLLDVEVFRLISGLPFARYRGVLEACAALHARELLVTCDVADEAEAADLLTDAADVAAQYGLFVNLEFMPFQAVRTLDIASRLVAKASRPNAAVLIDALHVHRAGVSVADLAQFDKRRMRYIQLCDGTVPPPDFDTMLFQARYERLMPGEGVIPLSDYLRALPRDCPLSLEVPMRGRLAEIGAVELAKQAMRTTRALLASLDDATAS